MLTPCLATIKVRIEEARDLPVMDSNTQLADAYVEVRGACCLTSASHRAAGQIKLNQKSEKTPIIKKSLNPQFEFDCRFEVSSAARYPFPP